MRRDVAVSVNRGGPFCRRPHNKSTYHLGSIVWPLVVATPPKGHRIVQCSIVSGLPVPGGQSEVVPGFVFPKTRGTRKGY